METVNGEFIMKGCDGEDPDCLHYFDDLVYLVKRSGFIPLFSNEIPGFSVEEHTTASSWWTEEVTDPWYWRQLASDHPDIAYGKFFNRNAGFISKDWFPVFANYRRNGYDYDALYDDGLASHKSKKIMDAFDLDEESVSKSLISSELRELAGKDETTLTQLQMQTYLIISDFRQRKNKNGQEYGWHLSVYETPETKWGRDFVASGYSADPMESWKTITAHMKKLYPEATESQAWRLLGIRWPGETAAPKKEPKKKVVKERMLKPQELPWPENLITEVGLNLVFPDSKEYHDLTDDQMVGLLHVFGQLKENEQTALRLRYEEHKTLQETADAFGLSRERVRQIAAKGLRKLRHPTWLLYYRDGFQATLKRWEDQASAIRNEQDEEKRMHLLYEVRTEDCFFSTRVNNCLIRAGYPRLGDAAYAIKKDPKAFRNIRNLGKYSFLEVLDKLDSYGFDTSAARTACNCEGIKE